MDGPLSDYNKTVTTYKFVLPALTYLVQTQVWPMAELQRIERDTRKIMVRMEQSTHKDPLCYSISPGVQGGGGVLKSVEAKYNITKIKAAVNIYGNTDPTMGRQY